MQREVHNASQARSFHAQVSGVRACRGGCTAISGGFPGILHGLEEEFVERAAPGSIDCYPCPCASAGT